MLIEINRKILSINHISLRRGYHTFITKEGKEMEKYIIESVNKQINKEEILPLIDKQLSVTIKVYENWFTKKGKIKRADLDNKCKYLLDFLFKALNIDDKHIWELKLMKIQKDTNKSEKALIIIEVL